MNEKPSIPKALTTEQVAEILQLSSKTIGEMIRNGDLPAMRIGGVWRVRPESLEEWMKQRESSHPAKD